MKKTYSFSNIRFAELRQFVNIQKVKDFSKFDSWFEADYTVSATDTDFLQQLIDFHYLRLPSYSEEDLKMKFLSVILNKIQFANNEINDFYDAALYAEVNGVELNGFADYMVAKGIDEPETPYFFLQEFKPLKAGKDVDDQLFAELIAAININKTTILRGAYIIGQNWRFVIMEKDAANNYTAYISKQFDSLELDDLKQIYKNLQIVKLHYCQ
ncbi:MAG: hypothetical protein ACOVQA_01490 [Thermoflexibacteraceae bacterium]|jgi:hypothetical protein